MSQRVLPVTTRFVARAAPELSASSPTASALAGAAAYVAVRLSR